MLKKSDLKNMVPPFAKCYIEELEEALLDMIDLAETAIECDQEDDIKASDRERIAYAKQALDPR